MSSAVSSGPRDRLARDGFVLVRGALDGATVERAAAALDRVYQEECARGALAPGAPMHLLGQIGRDDAFLALVDHPAVFPLIWGELGWNIHLYHCHLDVTPPLGGRRSEPVWGWHQDGGRQNLDLDGRARPRMSLKVAYWLSDVSAPGRGNVRVIPGSHRRGVLRRPRPGARSFREPEGAEPILAEPGDALVFDRRLWHSRSENHSTITRRAIFLAYTFRWIRPRDTFGIDPSDARFTQLTPVQRQLLGEPADPYSHWGLRRGDVALHAELSGRGLLEPGRPTHR